MDNQIITSILDSDLYKFSMQQCVFHQYPLAQVKYDFKCRNKDIKLGFLEGEIKEQIKAMKDVILSKNEKEYLSNLNFITPDYLKFLEDYRFNPDEVTICNSNGELLIWIDGSWKNTILWEVPLLSIVNELYFRSKSNFDLKAEGEKRLANKIKLLEKYPTLFIAEFGTRRRYSKDWQEFVLRKLIDNSKNIIGTSNVKLAMDFGIKPIGTVAHEFISCHLSLVDRLELAQKRAMHVWLQEFGDNLGIMLSDTFTTDAFFRDFDIILANAYKGVRQDSGNPILFGEKTIDHYKKLGIDPMTKIIVFSDGLNIPTAINIYENFVNKIGQCLFGIGTDLSNDLGISALNIVIKAVCCNNIAVVKLSDNISKAIGDPVMVERVKKAYKIKEEK